MNSPSKSRDMLGRTDTVSLKEALTLLHKHMPPRPDRIVTVKLNEALGRICAHDIRSPENLPPYPRSTMDGFAVRARDTFGAGEKLPAYLEVTGDVSMGEFPEHGPSPGTCFQIATGGILPPGADAVVMLEHTVPVDDQLIEIVKPAAVGANIINPGEDIAQGEILLKKGHRLRPQDIGLLAGVGLQELAVYGRVRVGIISTGDEIVPHKDTPPPGKVRDMNSITLASEILKNNAHPTFYGIAADEEQSLTAMMHEARTGNDIVLLSGSSSVGTRDLGEKVLEGLGKPGIIFHGVSIKPGKPVMLARAGNTLLFGLPGHPVSAAVAFDLFVRPAINGISGAVDSGLPGYRTMQARLMRNINSAAGRTDFIRIRIKFKEDKTLPEAHPVLGKSGALSTMVRAHGFIEIEEKLQGLKGGTTVEVKLFD